MSEARCPRCGGSHLERQCRLVISRRRFIFLGTAAAAAVVAAPYVELAPATAIDWGVQLPSTDWATFNGILKELYEPLIVEAINKSNDLRALLLEQGHV
jgi:hypothetical protein